LAGCRYGLTVHPVGQVLSPSRALTTALPTVPRNENLHCFFVIRASFGMGLTSTVKETEDRDGRNDMVISSLLILVAVSMLYLVLGLWAITKIFPTGRSAARKSNHYVGGEL
jgi:hypothetical protein